MKASDLRLGNWVLEDGNYHQWNIYDYTLNIDFYKPIPLTPEILEKCGFEKCGLLNSKRQCIKWENDFFYIYFDGENFNWEQVRDEFGSMIEGVELKYLHQLQNLFFAITNEEINFTP